MNQEPAEDYGFETSSGANGDPSLVPAILAGLGAALLGGIAWTVIMALTGYELGIAAWALGALVGFGMSRATTLRGAVPAASAAALALVGLLIARVLIGEFVMSSAGVDEVLGDQELMMQATTVDMQFTDGFPPDLQIRYDAVPEGDTLTDALWEEMLAAGSERAATLSPEERTRVAEQFAFLAMGQMGAVDRVTAQMGAFDLLWAFLAVSTAWGMMKHEDGEMLLSEEDLEEEAVAAL